MIYTKDSIRKAFRYRLQGSQKMKRIVCETLLIFPKSIIEKVTSKCWFISSYDDTWAFALRGDELDKDEHLIFLSDELLQESEDQIRYTVVHEIGHVILEHKNAILERQSKSQIRKQERQADQFVIKYLHRLG